MNVNSYRDMSLLDELTRSPEVTQRELSKRIGVALGLINLLLRRLVNKGYLKIKGTKRSRIRYLITPQGILEKSRLTYEFVQYSLQLYSRVRLSLRQQLAMLAQTSHRRALLFGTGELAELAFLTMREMGVELVGVVDLTPSSVFFLGYPVHAVRSVSPDTYDCLVVALPRWETDVFEQLLAAGVPRERIIILPGGPAVAAVDVSQATAQTPEGVNEVLVEKS